MIYKKHKTSNSRKRKHDTIDRCIVNALQLMQETDQIICLVQSPTSRVQELTQIFQCEFPNLQCTMSLMTSHGPSAQQVCGMTAREPPSLFPQSTAGTAHVS